MLGPLWSSSRFIQVVNTAKGMIHYTIPLSIESPCSQIAAIRLEVPVAELNALTCDGKGLKEVVITVKGPLDAASLSSQAELR